MLPYCPEGYFVTPPSADALYRSINTGDIFQAMCVKCDEFHNLHVDLGTLNGIIPRDEVALGIKSGETKEFAILSRVGKPVSFQVIAFDRNGTAILSRRAAQEEARSYFLSAVHVGDIIPAVVQNPANFGAFCDIGCGLTALMRIDRCCISRLSSTADLFSTGQHIFCAVLSIDDLTGRIELTGRELLGTWNENAERFRQGQTVAGVVRSIMPYGTFIELSPNLSGLVEPEQTLTTGTPVSVYIRSIQEDRRKIKLNVLEALPYTSKNKTIDYQITEGHLDRWEYFPGSNAVTVF